MTPEHKVMKKLLEYLEDYYDEGPEYEGWKSNGLEEAIKEAEQLITASQPAPAGCTMGVGCDETGVCYAKANGQPDRCENPAADTGQAVAWRYRFKVRISPGFSAWEFTDDESHARNMTAAGGEFEPLYTHPASLDAIPRAENCGRYLAEGNEGQWYYLNHANTWQGYQGPLDAERVSELEARLREITDACEADCGVPDADDEDDEAVGSCLEADGVTIRPMALTFGILRRARALLERNPS